MYPKASQNVNVGFVMFAEQKSLFNHLEPNKSKV